MNHPDQQLLLFESPRPQIGKYSFFFAVFPNPHTAERIVELGNTFRCKHGMQGRLRPLSHLHVSLHFFGYGSDVSKTLARVLAPACKAATAQTLPFEVEFDRVLSFRGRPGNHPLVLVGDDRGNEPLRKLHQLLEVQLVKNRLSTVPNTKFVPHITLLYDKQNLAAQPIDSVAWKVEELVLVRSEVGATKYQRVSRWALGG
jgi:2'-5' RNA ligase